MHIYAFFCHLFTPITRLSVSILTNIRRETFENDSSNEFVSE
jgi:hypothetical protein